MDAGNCVRFLFCPSMRPLIGITGDLPQNSSGHPLTGLNEAYWRAVAEAGGAPVVIPPNLGADAAEALVAALDGILFSGGGDVEPWRYHSAERANLIEVNRARDELELSLVQLLVTSRKPFLGICRGCQVLNVALGGTLYEDLDTYPASGVRHNVPGKESAIPAHDVALEADASLARIMERQSFGVNSHHHQGLRDIPSALRISARAPDGLVEAVEVREHPFALAVQWHPEWLTHDEWTRKLFSAFVTAASAGP